VVRIDEEDTAPIAPAIVSELAFRAGQAIPAVDAVLISDYAKGLLVPELLGRIIAAANRCGKPVVADPKGNDCRIYAGATVIKPNRSELAALTGRPVRTHDETLAAARQLVTLMGSTAVVVTEGKEGMTLLCPGAPERQFPASAREVYDVTGAGDTVTAALALALASGATLEDAVWLSNVAAGLAVAEVGTVAVSYEKLALAIGDAAGPAQGSSSPDLSQ
jgi:D-beta-D-heptose 7-phosphate kinase/D-beta-D-heptose 1-phosphate adenosyltransferase